MAHIDFAQREDHCYFVVQQLHHGEFTAADLNKPIIAGGQPIGVITIVTEDSVYGIVWTRYYERWRTSGGIITV